MAPQVDPATIPQLDSKADSFLSALMTAQTRSPEFAKQAADVRAMGDADIRRAAETSNRLLQTPVRALKEGGVAEGSKVGNTLLELRVRSRALTRAGPPDAQVSRGDPLRRQDRGLLPAL